MLGYSCSTGDSTLDSEGVSLEDPIDGGKELTVMYRRGLLYSRMPRRSTSSPCLSNGMPSKCGLRRETTAAYLASHLHLRDAVFRVYERLFKQKMRAK